MLWPATKEKKKNPSREEGPEIPRETSLFQCCYRLIWRCAHITDRTIKLHNRKTKLWHFSSLFSSICFKWVEKVYFKICQCDTQGLMSDSASRTQSWCSFAIIFAYFILKEKKQKNPKETKPVENIKYLLLSQTWAKLKSLQMGWFWLTPWWAFSRKLQAEVLFSSYIFCFSLAPDSRLAQSVIDEFPQTCRCCQEKTSQFIKWCWKTLLEVPSCCPCQHFLELSRPETLMRGDAIGKAVWS